ncbi:MAG TPA: hypothetical protein HPP69_07840 [Deltaproteobacteria bacterium]|nr:hypothetical protein [Deltaproteobacteria bacterium]
MIDKKNKYGDWESEFLEFIDSNPLSPPPLLTEKIKAEITNELRPAIWLIFSKLAGLQLVCATVTLFFCPQFEIGFTGHDHLADLIPHSDGFGFMVICGIIFLGVGAAIAPLFMKKTELLAIDNSGLLYFPTAALVAVMLFYGLGADLSLHLTLPWFLGGALGGLISFEIVRYLRCRAAELLNE